MWAHGRHLRMRIVTGSFYVRRRLVWLRSWALVSGCRFKSWPCQSLALLCDSVTALCHGHIEWPWGLNEVVYVKCHAVHLQRHKSQCCHFEFHFFFPVLCPALLKRLLIMRTFSLLMSQMIFPVSNFRSRAIQRTTTSMPTTCLATTPRKILLPHKDLYRTLWKIFGVWFGRKMYMPSLCWPNVLNREEPNVRSIGPPSRLRTMET